MSRTKEFMPILIALIIGLLGSMIAYKWVQGHTQGPAVKTVAQYQDRETVEIVVADRDLIWGTKLSAKVVENKLVVKRFLSESLPPGYFENLAGVQNRVLLNHIGKGEPILESDLAPVDVKRGGVSALIKPGNRAMTVEVNSSFGETGFIEPGRRKG